MTVKNAVRRAITTEFRYHRPKAESTWPWKVLSGTELWRMFVKFASVGMLGQKLVPETESEWSNAAETTNQTGKSETTSATIPTRCLHQFSNSFRRRRGLAGTETARSAETSAVLTVTPGVLSPRRVRSTFRGPSCEVLQRLRPREGDGRDRRDDQEDDDRDRARQREVLSLSGRDRELVRVADQDVGRARDPPGGVAGTARGEQVDVVEVEEVERERRDQERRDGDEEERQGHPPEDLDRSASVDPGRLDQLVRDRLQCAQRDEEEVGNRQPEADEDHRDLRPVAVEEPGAVQPDVVQEDPVDDPEVVVQQPLPDEQREEARHRPGDQDRGAVEAPEPHPLLVQDDREKQADRERQEDDRDREHERPPEDLQERLPDRRVVDDA